MATATLPDVPRSPHELEDYVAALFQAAGYFVEKHIEETDVLELDAVATAYEGPVPTSVLVEAKGGSWGYADIFKVIGWMRYLAIGKGAFFVSTEKEGHDPESVHGKVAPLGLAFVHLGDFSAAEERFRAAGFPEIRDDTAMTVWRFAYQIERKLIDRLRVIAKSAPDRAGPMAALSYHRLVNDHIFFVRDVLERLHALYGAYAKHPKLSLGIACEMAGRRFDPENADPNNRYLREAMYEGQHPLIQASFYVEHRARLAVLKAAVDQVCLGGGVPPPSQDGTFVGLDQLPFDLLPVSFREGLDRLSREPFFIRYALFWQVFLWGFGGFYLADRQDIEFQWLSEQTGVPPDEIPRALGVFDALFPSGDSWVTQPGPTHCRIVKMVPMPFQGLGAYHRWLRYGLSGGYKELGYPDYTVNDLTRWNNAAVTLLTS